MVNPPLAHGCHPNDDSIWILMKSGPSFLMLKSAFLGGQGRTPHIKTRPCVPGPYAWTSASQFLRTSRPNLQNVLRSVVPKASLRSFQTVCSSNWENQHWNICYMCFWRWENQLSMDIYMRKSTINSEYSLFVVLKIGRMSCLPQGAKVGHG